MLSLTNESLLIDTFPPSAPHNVSARILRLGIAINSFSSLEAYIRSRFEEAVDKLTSMALPYTQMPNDLREFLMVKSLEGLITKSGRVKPLSAKLALIEGAISTVAKFNHPTPSYSAYGFSPKGSNVESGDISAALKAFTIKEPWDKVKQLTGLFGTVQVDLATEYAKLSAYRHRAAHEAASNIPTSDLQNHIRNSMITGICADMLLTQSLIKLAAANSLVDASRDLDINTIKIRFVDAELDGNYVERASAMGGVLKRSNSLPAALAIAGGRMTAKFIVVRDVSMRPIGLASANASGIL